jgi:hypothetical protein
MNDRVLDLVGAFEGFVSDSGAVIPNIYEESVNEEPGSLWSSMSVARRVFAAKTTLHEIPIHVAALACHSSLRLSTLSWGSRYNYLGLYWR